MELFAILLAIIGLMLAFFSLIPRDYGDDDNFYL